MSTTATRAEPCGLSTDARKKVAAATQTVIGAIARVRAHMTEREYGLFIDALDEHVRGLWEEHEDRKE